MMEEKRGMVDFLHTAVACLRDLPRGHIINLAQHLQQVSKIACCFRHCLLFVQQLMYSNHMQHRASYLSQTVSV